MKKIILIVFGIGFFGTLCAQELKLPVGKKFLMVTEVKGNSVTSMMGQDMEMATNTKVYVDHELKTVNANNFSMGLIIKRIAVNLSMMGQEHNFDSDDESARSNPAYGEALKTLGKETEVLIEDGKVVVNGGLVDAAKAILGNTADVNDMGRIFLLLKDADIKTGHAWTSNTSSGGSSTESSLSIEKITEREIEVLVNSKLKISTTINQNGMEVKQQTEGTSKATRIYDKLTGLLISETAISDIKGNMELMGQQVPLSSKLEMKTTIKLL